VEQIDFWDLGLEKFTKNLIEKKRKTFVFFKISKGTILSTLYTGLAAKCRHSLSYS